MSNFFKSKKGDMEQVPTTYLAVGIVVLICFGMVWNVMETNIHFNRIIKNIETSTAGAAYAYKVKSCLENNGVLEWKQIENLENKDCLPSCYISINNIELSESVTIGEKTEEELHIFVPIEKDGKIYLGMIIVGV